jgi:hypothetical protein
MRRMMESVKLAVRQDRGWGMSVTPFRWGRAAPEAERRGRKVLAAILAYFRAGDTENFPAGKKKSGFLFGTAAPLW